MEKRNGYIADKNYPRYGESDGDFDLMVKEEMEKLERQVRNQAKISTDYDQLDEVDDYQNQGYYQSPLVPPRANIGVGQTSNNLSPRAHFGEERVSSNISAPPNPRGIMDIGSKDLTYAQKRAKQQEYARQLTDSNTPTNKGKLFTRKDDLSQAPSGPDLFSGLGQGDPRQKSRMNQANAISRTGTRSAQSYVPMDPPSKTILRSNSGISFMDKIGQSDYDITAKKRFQQMEYNRQLQVQVQDDEVRREKLSEELGRPYSRSKSTGRIRAPSDSSSQLNSPFGAREEGFDVHTKQAKQQEYFRQLKEQQQLDAYNKKLVDETASQYSESSDVYDGGLLKGVGARERPKSAGRRRVNPPSASGGNIFSGVGGVPPNPSQMKKTQQEAYRRQLEQDQQRNNELDDVSVVSRDESTFRYAYEQQQQQQQGGGRGVPSYGQKKPMQSVQNGQNNILNGYGGSNPASNRDGRMNMNRQAAQGSNQNDYSYGNYPPQQQRQVMPPEPSQVDDYALDELVHRQKGQQQYPYNDDRNAYKGYPPPVVSSEYPQGTDEDNYVDEDELYQTEQRKRVIENARKQETYGTGLVIGGMLQEERGQQRKGRQPSLGRGGSIGAGKNQFRLG